jgi:hypothetical protein
LNPKSRAAERPGQDTEILFIEQCWHYLAEGGYLSIVIPDGILTNSSLQYVRDEIEDLYRIVAVISLPQTAFTSTGAGVKSSVLFLKKHSGEETKRMRDTKQKLKDSIRAKERMEAKLDALEREKKAATKELNESEEFAALTKDERKENEAYTTAAQEISDRFNAQADELRYQLAEQYEERRSKDLPDYPIFMAIAEDIGYDATGRQTKTKELEPIAEELARFIAAIEEGMSFLLSSKVNPSRFYIEQKANVTGRWDPLYYRPELVELEKHVRSVTPHRLRDFVIRMAGGATPSTAEPEKHYTESDDGVPFIRVQNLSTSGRLNLSDCKHITRSTHETLLKRSRLKGGELLIKITGVGRMAIASVVPENFEGNINQHIVAIQTKDIATSESLAAYLNLDMAERLASRRSTGGTRPALDYPALLSIPIVYDKRIPRLMIQAVDTYQRRIKGANADLEKAKHDIEALILGQEGDK